MRHGRTPRTAPPPSTGSRLRDRTRRQRTANTMRDPTTDPNGRNKPFNPKTNRHLQYQHSNSCPHPPTPHPGGESPSPSPTPSTTPTPTIPTPTPTSLKTSLKRL